MRWTWKRRKIVIQASSNIGAHWSHLSFVSLYIMLWHSFDRSWKRSGVFIYNLSRLRICTLWQIVGDILLYVRTIALCSTNSMFVCCCCLFVFVFVFFWQEADRLLPKHMRQLSIWRAFCQVERRFNSRELNRQPLPWDLGISLSSSNILESSWTKFSQF